MNLSINQTSFTDRTNYRQNVNFRGRTPGKTALNYLLSSDINPEDLQRLKKLSESKLSLKEILDGWLSQSSGDVINNIIDKIKKEEASFYNDSNTLKSKKEIQKIIESRKTAIMNEKNIIFKTGKIHYMVKDCFIDTGGLKTAWSPLWDAIRRNTPNAMEILTRILLADESRNKMVDDLVKEMTDAINRNREDYYKGVRAGIHNSDPLILRSKKEIQEIIESRKTAIMNQENIIFKTDKICNMVKDCFIDRGDHNTPWESLWNAIRRNTPNAMEISTKILLADESRNKMVDDLVKEMADAINRNRERNYTRTQSGSTQQKTGQTQQESGINNPQKKKGWTEEQFVEHILKVVTDTHFRLAALKPSEIRNLAKMFGIKEEQVKNLDKDTYYELAKMYHPNADDTAPSDKFVILSTLYEKSQNKS